MFGTISLPRVSHDVVGEEVNPKTSQSGTSGLGTKVRGRVRESETRRVGITSRVSSKKQGRAEKLKTKRNRHGEGNNRRKKKKVHRNNRFKAELSSMLL